MWKHFRNPLGMVRILFENPLSIVGEKNILLVCVQYPHAGECATALHITFFFQKCYFTAWFGTDLFIVVERSKDIMHVKILRSLVASAGISSQGAAVTLFAPP